MASKNGILDLSKPGILIALGFLLTVWFGQHVVEHLLVGKIAFFQWCGVVAGVSFLISGLLGLRDKLRQRRN